MKAFSLDIQNLDDLDPTRVMWLAMWQSIGATHLLRELRDIDQLAAVVGGLMYRIAQVELIALNLSLADSRVNFSEVMEKTKSSKGVKDGSDH